MKDPSIEVANKTGGDFHVAMPVLDHLADLRCKARTKLPWSLKVLNRGLMSAFLILVTAMIFLPWQQFVQGSGKVIAFNPLERSVVLEAPLAGRVDEVHVMEGEEVKRGQILFRLTDNDPDLMKNLQRQKTNLEGQREAASARLNRLKNQFEQTEKALNQSVEMVEKQLQAARYAEKAATLQFDRIKALYEDPRGLASQREYELAVMSRDQQSADVSRLEASLAKSRLDLNASLESLQASIESAKSDLNKVEKEWTDLEIKINQTGRLTISAPRDGVVVRLQVNEGAFLKSGDPLCTIVPYTDHFVAEIWIDGNDMPLVRERLRDEQGNILRKGSPVRLQFEGWPAIQFVGWPSVAIGTFGGEVIFVDRAGNGQGLFRALVEPDPDQIRGKNGELQSINWPEPPVMRQGILTQGWVLLERVPLWFEVWRQINGFPPALSRENPIREKAEKS